MFRKKDAVFAIPLQFCPLLAIRVSDLFPNFIVLHPFPLPFAEVPRSGDIFLFIFTPIRKKILTNYQRKATTGL